MPITITFHKFSEKKPEHEQDIIWLEKTSSFGYYDFNPRQVKAYYDWEEVDEEGCPTGNAVCYEEGDGETLDGHRLQVMLGHYYAEPEDLWVGVEDYWESFSEEGA